MKFNFDIKKEWDEVKRFEKLSDEERSIVFYSENKHDFIYYESIIKQLTDYYDKKICYVSSHKLDPMLETSNEKILPFYIGTGIACAKFFINLKSKIIIMTMPDLETFHIKRSKVQNVHYVHILHSLNSVHVALRKNALDNFDTIFCASNYHIDEIRGAERAYNLPKKILVEQGYGRLESLLQEVKNRHVQINNKKSERKIILIAPSWGPNGLIETIGKEIVEILLNFDYDVILRPHPMTLRKSEKLIEEIRKRFENNPNFTLEIETKNSNSFFICDCMISDWSGVAIEYAFSLEKPVLYIDVPQKIFNPNFDEIGIVPMEDRIRNQIGEIVSPQQLSNIPLSIENLFKKSEEIKKTIQKIRNETVFNIGNSGNVGAKYIIDFLDKTN